MKDNSTILKGRTILLGVTGSIAAYKAADIISRLIEEGADVLPIMTVGACNFVQPLTLQTLSRNPVYSDLWKEGEAWQPGHIDLAELHDHTVPALFVNTGNAHTELVFLRIAPALGGIEVEPSVWIAGIALAQFHIEESAPGCNELLASAL